MKPNYRVNFQPIQSCFRESVLIGDSITRELFNALEAKWGRPDNHEDGPAHSNLTFALQDGDTIDFIWDPYLNNTHLAALRNTKASPHAGVDQQYSPTSVVVGGGLWHARYLNESASILEKHLENLVASRRGLRPSEAIPIFLPLIQPYSASLDPERSATLTPERIRGLNEILVEVSSWSRYDVLEAVLVATQRYPSAYLDDGLHHTPIIAWMQLEVLAARMCPLSYDHTCCSKTEHQRGQLLVVTAASVTIVLIIVASLSTTAQLLPYQQPVRALVTIGAVVLYAFVTDRTIVFEKVTKLVDEQLFIAFVVLTLIAAVFTLRPTGAQSESWAADILPREQTDEWKGWMQVVILLYHYFGMSQVSWSYRLVRVLVAAYLFLTGYGHASYFLRTNDFSLRRVAPVLIRINILCCTLAFFMGTHYQFYYFPMLASIWFIVTWATVPRNAASAPVCTGLAILVSMAVTTFVHNFWLVDGFFALLYHIGMTSLDYKEFEFRVGLDLYAPYVGMILAITLALITENGIATHPDGANIRRLVCLIALLALALYLEFVTRLSSHDPATSKQVFNRYHPYISFIPILAYVALRNATPTLRRHYSCLLAWIGRHSLETFVLQHHIWLAADTHGILHLGLIDRDWDSDRSTKGSWRFWTEVFLVTVMFFWICSLTAKATAVLVDAVLGPKNAQDEKEGLIMQEPLLPGASRTWTWREQWVRYGDTSRLGMKLFAILGAMWLLNWSWPV
jgi:N-acetylneuraminate 9-O-acetyltransferase